MAFDRSVKCIKTSYLKNSKYPLAIKKVISQEPSCTKVSIKMLPR